MSMSVLMSIRMKGPGFFVSVSVRFFLVVLSGLFVVVAGGCVTAYRGLICENDIVVRLSVIVEEG
jgi:hypothetical protein